MEFAEIFPLLMFPVLFLGILTGFPVAFVLAGIGFVFGLLGAWFELFYLTDFGFIPSKLLGVIENVTLMAVPLFIFMGITLERSGLAEELLSCMERLCQKIRGGLLLAIVLVGAVLAASTGIVGATVVTMGVLSLPGMLHRKYSIPLSCGTIAAAGTLGQIIPPSIVLILLADMMNIAVADLFAGAILPGFLLVFLYLAYVASVALLWPEKCPVCSEEVFESQGNIVWQVIKSFLPPFLLITLVLGTILFGVASPTESAACGALGALVLAGMRRRLSWEVTKDISKRTTEITAMVFTLLFGAQVFSVAFRGMYGDEVVLDLLTGFDLAPLLLLLLTLFLLFILGFFLDFLEICFIVIPVLGPILTIELGLNPVWVAILFALNLQTSFLTPPFGFSLFYLKGVAPKQVRSIDIYRGIIPFVVIQVVVLSSVIAVPGLATWLPEYFFSP